MELATCYCGGTVRCPSTCDSTCTCDSCKLTCVLIVQCESCREDHQLGSGKPFPMCCIEGVAPFGRTGTNATGILCCNSICGKTLPLIMGHIPMFCSQCHEAFMSDGEQPPAIDERLLRRITGSAMPAGTLLTCHCEQLISGSMVYSDLDFLIRSARSFNHACDRHAVGDCAHDIHGWLALRQQEKRQFDEIHAGVKAFVALCKQLGEAQLLDLPMKVKEDLSQKRLTDLWVPKRDISTYVTLECHYFPNTETILTGDVLGSMKKVHGSLLFASYWQAACNKFQNFGRAADPSISPNMRIEVTDIINFIWKDAFRHYTDFRERLRNGAATFGDAEKLLTACKNVFEDVTLEVVHLAAGSECKVIEKQMLQYCILRTCLSNVHVMLDLCDKFKLTGISDDLDVLMSWDARKNRRLSYITDKHVEICEKLKALEDHTKVECLFAFVDCAELVEWIKESCTEFREAKAFLDLASAAAGEGGDEIKNILCLRTSVIGYKPLLYKLPSCASLGVFLRRCETIWKNLDANTSLAEQLRTTQKNIKWVKSVKEAVGSLEVSSLAAATALNVKGVYEVGFLGCTECTAGRYICTFDYVARATVPLKSKAEVKTGPKEYRYSDLLDLQSALTAMASRATEGNAEIRDFMSMFRSIRRLAEAYSKTCEVGVVMFDSWKMQFKSDKKEHCKEDVSVFIDGIRTHTDYSEISYSQCAEDLADFLDRCAEDWLLIMKRLREKHSLLNVFTSKQIAFLRKELGRHLKPPGSAKEECDNKVYPILAMLVPCNQTEVAEALAEVKDMLIGFESCETPAGFLCSAEADIAAESTFPSLRLGCCPQESGKSRLVMELSRKWTEFLSSASTCSSSILSIDHLCHVLKVLARNKPIPCPRPLPEGLERGRPHLIVCPQGQVLSAALSLYMADVTHPMPTRNEVVLCTASTSVEEVDLLLKRAFADSMSVYCLAHGQRLSYDACCHLEKVIEEYQRHDREYFIAVICAEEREDKSHTITALQRFRTGGFHIKPVQDIQCYISQKLTVRENAPWSAAWLLDHERSSCRVIKSRRPGIGKTLYVRRLIDHLHTTTRYSAPSISIQLLQPEVDVKAVLAKLLQACCQPVNHQCRVVHVNIAQEVHGGVDELLFNLLVLGSMCQDDGFVWQTSKDDYYIIETVPLQMKIKVNKAETWQDVHSMLDLLPSRECISPQECLRHYQQPITSVTPGTSPVLMDEIEFRSESWQRTYQYLKRHKENIGFCRIPQPSVEGCPADMLTILLEYCGLDDPSWAELRHFTHFLNAQLKDCEESAFCGPAATAHLPGFLNFIVEFILKMSRDFATRSLKMSEESPELQQALQRSGDNWIQTMEMKRTWESSTHPYIFFNPDRNSLTFLGFCVERRTGNLFVPGTKRVLEHGAVSKDLFDGLVQNSVDLSEDFEEKTREEKIEKICAVMGNTRPHDPDSSYELTLENVKKILAIQMRFRCGIPVIMMGETGCGKTRLIKFMCDLQVPKGQHMKNLVLTKMHAGIKADDIKKKINEAIQLAKENKTKCSQVDTVLFLDEANATDTIGLIKEVMCDDSLDGEPLGNVGLRIIAAVNPYRKHTPTTVEQLEKAGLGYYVKANETPEKLGSIPMRHLVYRVRALPQSLLPLVWDFGKLTPDAEEKYINQMIHKYSVLTEPCTREATARVLMKCQQFMRSQEDACYMVSLRDVDRVLKVMSWFHEKHDLLYSNGDEASESMSQAHCRLTWSLVMALGVCYQARLQPGKRADFREAVGSLCVHPLLLPGGGRQMLDEIKRCQSLLVDSMREYIGSDIACNHALKENIFVIVVCVELRIPLFLVGKPGSSKSLAMAIVGKAMQGKRAGSPIFKRLKEVQLASLQCSPLTTPAGIIAMFEQCTQVQKTRNLDSFVSVVVLDELGMAEDSRLTPLKCLHSLLEEGCDGTRQPVYTQCAFVGISNWALDPATMNRGILVQCSAPDNVELERSARYICQLRQSGPDVLGPHLGGLSAAYLRILNEVGKQREFFGLRDFYSLLKMLACFAEERGALPTPLHFLYAILKSFGGFEDAATILRIFGEELGHTIHVSAAVDCSYGSPHCAFELIGESINEQRWGRYPLAIVDNDTALSLVQSRLQADGQEIIFGSSFPRDTEYAQVCQSVMNMKHYMDAGKAVMLLNPESENLFAALHNVLKQDYVYLGGLRFVRLSLGDHSVVCGVHSNFRLFVVAERKLIHEKFPVSFINCLEKHYVKTASLLTTDQGNQVENLCRWAQDFVDYDHLHVDHQGRSRCTGMDTDTRLKAAFIGYSADAAAVLIVRATEEIAKLGVGFTDVQVLQKAKHDLLLLATPDAVLRVKDSVLAADCQEIFNMYNGCQLHCSLESMLVALLVENQAHGDLLLQVTTHDKLLSRDDVNLIARQIAETVAKDRIRVIYALQAIDTQLEFIEQIRDFYESGSASCTASGRRGQSDSLLIVQCGAGHENGRLVTCARHVISKVYSAAQVGEYSQQPCKHHVVLVVQLPQRAEFHGFPGGMWICVHIDDLRPRKKGLPSVWQVHDKAISEVLQAGLPDWPTTDYGVDYCSRTMCAGVNAFNVQSDSPFAGQRNPSPGSDTAPTFDTYVLLRHCVHEAASRLTDSQATSHRCVPRLEALVGLFSHEGNRRFQKLFARCLVQLIRQYEQERMTAEMSRRWLSGEAAALKNVMKFGTFRRSLEDCLKGKIASFFAVIIAYIDTNFNLDLLDLHGPADQTWRAKLWLDIFAGITYTSLQMTPIYGDMMGTQSRLEVPTNVRSRNNKPFLPAFPFSWLLKEQLNAMTALARTHRDSYEVLEGMLANDKAFGCITSGLSADNQQAVVTECYLHDFVYLSYRCNALLDHKIVFTSIKKMLQNKRQLTIPGVHLGFADLEPHLLRLQRILELDESIDTNLLEQLECNTLNLEEDNELTSDVLALHFLLENLEPNDCCSTSAWLSKIHKCRTLVEQMLSAGSSAASVLMLRRCRDRWNRLMAAQIFVDCVVGSPLEASITLSKVLNMRAARTLYEMLEFCCDFNQLRAFETLERFLACCYNDVLAASDGESNAQRLLFRQLANHFLVRVLTDLVFAGFGTPDRDLIKHALTYVTLEAGRAHDANQLNHLVDNGLFHTTPVSRSLLLRLLLRSSEGLVSDYVGEFFRKTAMNINDRGDDPAMLEFCILFISCFEDYNAEKLSASSAADLSASAEANDYVNRVLQHDSAVWLLFSEDAASNADTLHSLAAVRLCLLIGADVVYRQALAPGGSQTVGGGAATILDRVRLLCDRADDRQCPWPRIFLAKQIIRKYGTSSFLRALAVPSLRFVAPKEFHAGTEKVSLPDPFVIATTSEAYAGISKALSNSIVDEKMDALHSYMAGCQEPEFVKNMFSVMAVCSVLTRNYYSTDSAINIKPEVITMVEGYMIQAWPTGKNMFVGLLRNSLPGCLSINPRLTHGEVMVALLICRLSAVLLAKEEHPCTIVSPFTVLLLSPSSMQKVFFPTMPHDTFQDVKDTIKQMTTDIENLLAYACPNNHIYFIGNCGRAYVLDKCPECGSVIGGTSHFVADGNRDVKFTEDRTQPGHVLGSTSIDAAVVRSVLSVRDLTPQSCILLRVLLHMTLYASAALNGNHKVAALIRPTPDAMLEYLWMHLLGNLETLQTMLNKPLDDCLIFLHTLISRLADITERVDFDWTTQDGRRMWETTVQSSLLAPAIRECDSIVADGAEALKSDLPDTSAALALVRLLEEPDGPADLRALTSNPVVWRYRESPSIQHFVTQFENHCSTLPHNSARETACNFAALQKFLQNYDQLAAIRLLPEVLSLITSLTLDYGRRLSISDVRTLSIDDFLCSYAPGGSRDYSSLANDFVRAWNVVRRHLKSHVFLCRGQRFQVPADLCSTAMSMASPLRMLLAATRGLGLCCLALVTYLAKLQNDFLDIYVRACSQWLDPDVPLLSASHAHLIVFDADKDLLPVIIGNCEYSLRAGEGTLLHYNFENVQHQVMNRFIRHKPRLVLVGDSGGVCAIPHFLYREDLANGNQLKKLSNASKFQVDITPELKEIVRQEYGGDVTELSNMLVIIDQAVGFLLTTIAPSEMPLSTYLTDVLHMTDNSMTPTLRKRCLVCHVRALWLLLSLERAKALLLSDEDCFENVDSIYMQPIHDQSTTEKFLASLRKFQDEEWAANEGISGILYEFIVLRLANRSPYTDSSDESAEEDSHLPPSYPLFHTLLSYAEGEYRGTKTDPLGSSSSSIIGCLETLSDDCAELQLQHSVRVLQLMSGMRGC